jgi:hypothetical protein
MTEERNRVFLAWIAYAVSLFSILVADIWPGLLARLFLSLPGAIISIPVFSGILFFSMAIICIASKREYRKYQQIFLSLVCFTVSLSLVSISVANQWSQRVGHCCSRRSFELAVDAISSRKTNEFPYRKRLGVYKVLDVRQIQNSIYFITSSYATGLGPVRSISGFVFKPELLSSPFDDCSVDYKYISEDWAIFDAYE